MASRFLAVLFVALLLRPAQGFDPGKRGTPLAQKAFSLPELRIGTSNVPAESVLAGRLLESAGPGTRVFIDPRSGTPSNIITSVPMVPGSGAGNRLGLEDVARGLRRSVERIDANVVGELVLGFLDRNREAIGIERSQLGPARAEKVADHLWQVTIPQAVDGIPVRYGRVGATLNSGNLVLLGTETWGNVRIDPKPRITGAEALGIGFGYVDGKGREDDLWKKPELEIVPVAAPAHQDGGYGHRLVWAFGFTRRGEEGRWEMLVDAHTGELVAFEDRNHYETNTKKVSGGIYPFTATEVCPSSDRCGSVQPDSPMPFTNTGLPAPHDFTNGAGLFQYSGSGTVTTSLEGRFVRIADTCGSISEASATGDIDLGGVNGQHDCTSAGASPGDTPASRTAFYEVNELAEMARGWLPGNVWLEGQLRANVNIDSACNAFWDGSTINFYKSGSGCRNTGEIAGVLDHEWGHGLDDNDAGGELSSSSEAYADIAALYRLEASCVGYGFYQSYDHGCGATSDGTGFNVNESQVGTHCDLECSGARDADWDKHADHAPDTPQSFSCVHCGLGSGPCGRQVHCDAAPSRQAAWDLAARDLQAAPFGLSRTDAFIVAAKLFFQGSGNIGSWHACTCPDSSDGCGATNAYMQWLATDDDNGNLVDGTPHMTALFSAFDRHGIACGSPAPLNSGCAGQPASAPTLSAIPGGNEVRLSWTAVPGAVRYRVLRAKGAAGCESGKTVIAEISGTSTTDGEVSNGRAYGYVVHAVGTTGACFGPSSACVTATPQPCAGAITLGRAAFGCADDLDISLLDTDLTGAGSQTVGVLSTTETAAETVTLVESPAGSGRFSGTFPTTSAAPVAGDGALSVTHGDTVTVRYLDSSFCGPPDVDVEKTASVDCVGPVITNVGAAGITGSGADITWTTDEPADSRAIYGLVPPPVTATPVDLNLVTSHAVHVTGLEECTQYFFGVGSADLVGNSAFDGNAGDYYTFATSRNVTPTYASTDPPVGIPDLSPDGAVATIDVTDIRVIQDLNVEVDIAHAYDGNLDLFLIGPDGTTVLLAGNRGSNGDNFDDTVFDDEASAGISFGSPPFAGSFRPEQPLSAFDGRRPAGTWTLKVVDEASLTIGTIERFEISLTHPPQACGPWLEVLSHSLADTCPAGSGGGNGAIDPGESVVLPVTLANDGISPATGITAILSTTTPGVSITSGTSSYPDLIPGQSAPGATAFAFSVDPAVPCGSLLHFRVDAHAAEGSWNGTFTILAGTPRFERNFHRAWDTPQPIPDLRGTFSMINVAGPARVTDVDVRVRIDHPNDADLAIVLVAPNGAAVELSTYNGGSGNDYHHTIFDDEAEVLITAGAPGFTGRFRPEGYLGMFDGIPANGSWTLYVADSKPLDTGTLREHYFWLTTQELPECSCVETGPWLQWIGKETLEWTSVPDATGYNLYRGDAIDLPELLDESVDSCTRLSTGATTTGEVLTEKPDRAYSPFFWYLVRATTPSGEHPAGHGLIQNSWGPCWQDP